MAISAIPSRSRSGMHRILPPPVRGALLLALITVSTIAFGVPVFVLAVVKLAVPEVRWRHWWTLRLVNVAEAWIRLNNLMISVLMPTRFVFRGLEQAALRRDGRYLVASNHQNWSDVLVLQRLLIGHAPFLRFFIKQELIWLPVLGFAWWALDMPFMKRYSPEKLAAHPELRDKDLETTRRSCEHFRRGPISITNFIEGTRFTPGKRDRSGSPYRHLLKPKAGGVASVLDAFAGDLDTLVDVTIAYGKPGASFWDFLCGNIPTVTCEVRVETIPEDVRCGDYQGDDAFRERVQAWVRMLWDRKDARLAEMLGDGALG